MPSKNGKQPATSAGKDTPPQQPAVKKLPYTTRYVAVDSHLSERRGSSDSVSGVAGERPAGRKFAQDIASVCNQLDSEGYEVISIFPTTGGRTVEVMLEVDEGGPDWEDPLQTQPSNPVSHFLRQASPPSVKQPEPAKEIYQPMAAGYSVTDGAIITAKLRR